MSFCLTKLNEPHVLFLGILKNLLCRPGIQVAHFQEKVGFAAHNMKIGLKISSTTVLLIVVNRYLSTLAVSEFRLSFKILIYYGL